MLALRPWIVNIRIASLYSGLAVDRAGVATKTTGPFLNTALIGNMACAWRPGEVLALAKALEIAAGRTAAPRDTERPLDIDLLWLGDHRRNDPVLTLPHPGLLTRRFVLAPLAEIDPTLSLPPKGVTTRAALDALPSSAPPVIRRPWRCPPSIT